MKHEIVLGYADVAEDVVRRPGSLPAAGIYLLDGGSHVAAFGSRAAQRLAADGALLVAQVGFDGDPRERAYPGGTLVPLTTLRANRVSGQRVN
jgi:hypothetical protein